MPSRDLILLTNNFPFARGDASFIENEIGELALEFENIYVWTRHKDTSDKKVLLPSNVHYVGLLPGARGTSDVKYALSFAVLIHAASLIAADTRWFPHLKNLKRTVKEALTAAAGARIITKFLEKLPARNPVWAYSYWGTDCVSPLLLIDQNLVSRRVARFHRYDLYEDIEGFLPLRRSLFSRLDRILAISDDAADYLSNHYASLIDESKITVARLGTQDFGLGPVPSGSPVRVVSCSSVTQVKRVSLIHMALVELAKNNVVHWVHFGDGPLMEDLRRQIEETGDSGLVVDLHGEITHDELMSYYAAEPVDVFVNFSSSEGVPVSIMEAMSFGIPVVASDVGGTSEIVSPDFPSGELIAPDASAEVFAEAIQTVIERRESYRPRKTWEERSQSRQNVQLLLDCIETGSI